MLYRIERVLTCIPWHPRNFIVDAEQKVSIRTSWGRHKNVRTPDWPCPHQFYKFWLDFFTRCSSCTSRRIECRPYGVFFFLSRDMTDPTTRKKNKIDQNYSKKTKKSNRADTQSLWTYGSNTGLKIQCKILKIERGIAEMPFCRNYFIYGWNRILLISLDGWRIGQRDLHRSSPCLFSTVSTKFYLDRKRQFLHEFSVKKVGVFVFSRISRRDRVGKTKC